MKKEKSLISAYKELDEKSLASIDWAKVEKDLSEFYNANK